MPRLRLLLPLLLSTLAVGCADFPTSGPGYFVVNTQEDGVDAAPGDLRCATARGTCSLRAAIMESNAMPGANTVRLPAGTYTLAIPGTGAAESGDLDVTGPVQVLGAGVGQTIIDGNQLVTRDRIFDLQRERLNLLDLTLRNGGGNVDGGAIRTVTGALLLRRTVLTGNSAWVLGGALLNNALAEIEDSTFDNNEASGRGGAISNEPTGILGMDRSTVSNNRANLGAGINNRGEMTLYNVTVSQNTGSTGPGGIFNVRSLVLNDVTVTRNANNGDTRAAGVGNEPGAFLELSNTIVAGNENRGGPDNCSGTLTSRGYNLFDDVTGCTLAGDTTGNQVAIARLGALADNGGPTRTHMPEATSPAVNAGNPAAPGSSLVACRTTDQRGVARPIGGRCDIGAVER